MSTSFTIICSRFAFALFCLLICVCWQLTASVVTVRPARPRSPGPTAPLAVCLHCDGSSSVVAGCISLCHVTVISLFGAVLSCRVLQAAVQKVLTALQ